MSKIVQIIFSGLGGVQSGPNMLTELQQAHIPNMDALMRRSTCGLIWPTDKGKSPNPQGSLTFLLGMSQGNSEIEKLAKCAIIESNAEKSFFAEAGFSVLESESNENMVQLLEKNYSTFDIFVLYIEQTKTFGLQGEYYKKIIVLEQFDKHLQKIQALKPDVLVVTGDYSVPTELKKMSWHPVPVLLHSQHCRYDDVMLFDEISCRNGSLGHLYSWELMPIILANAEGIDVKV